ncbi:MAG: hypothetical protein CMA31_07430 [Euryarchaeota archaeon]|nr:hypothetical protein [Euryarchaeota archaeon]
MVSCNWAPASICRVNSNTQVHRQWGDSMDGDGKRAKRILNRIKKERDAVSARLERIDLDTSKSEIYETKKTIEAIENELKD